MSPASEAQLTKIVLQPSDFPAGWEHTPYTTDTAADISATYMGLINMKAKEIPSMNLVTPGDLENSFLWHKVHDTMDVLTSSLGSQCTLAMSKCGDCNPTMPCGSTMPYNGGAIDPGFECTIQNWIMGGAQNN